MFKDPCKYCLVSPCCILDCEDRKKHLAFHEVVIFPIVGCLSVIIAMIILSLISYHYTSKVQFIVFVLTWLFSIILICRLLEVKLKDTKGNFEYIAFLILAPVLLIFISIVTVYQKISGDETF